MNEDTEEEEDVFSLRDRILGVLLTSALTIGLATVGGFALYFAAYVLSGIPGVVVLIGTMILFYFVLACLQTIREFIRGDFDEKVVEHIERKKDAKK